MTTTIVVLATSAPPLVSIEIGAAVTWLLAAITALLAALFALIGWVLRRELAHNKEAHRELRDNDRAVESDVKLLLAGNAPWVQGMRMDIAKLREEVIKLYQLLSQGRSPD